MYPAIRASRISRPSTPDAMAMYTIQGVVADEGVWSTLGVTWTWAHATAGREATRTTDSASALAASFAIELLERTTGRILAVALPRPAPNGARPRGRFQP
jgi:hypothetical protein